MDPLMSATRLRVHRLVRLQHGSGTPMRPRRGAKRALVRAARTKENVSGSDQPG